MHMQAMDGPDIRWSVLAGEAVEEHDDEEGHDDEHAEAHAGYDLETFRMAVVEGKHPNGERLSNDMPRWNLSEDDLADLAAFLKSPSLLKKGEKQMGPEFFGWGGMWWIFPIIFMGICVVFFMLRMFGRGGFRPPWQDSSRDHRESRESETALEILRKRYAKGEISKEEYEEMKRDL